MGDLQHWKRGSLLARTRDGSTFTDTAIPGNLLGTAHIYRIDWLTDQVVFYIDGAPVATHAIAIATNMRPAISDSTTVAAASN